MKGRLTIRTAGVFFWLSALLEILSIRIEVPILGVLRGGLVAGAAHTVFAAVFVTIGAGLWTGARWGPRVVYLATALYSIDRFRYMLDWAGREAELRSQLAGHPEIIEAFGVDLLLKVGALLALLFVGCWWGFAAYIYVRREYFLSEASRLPRGVGGPGGQRPQTGERRPEADGES